MPADPANRANSLRPRGHTNGVVRNRYPITHRHSGAHRAPRSHGNADGAAANCNYTPHSHRCTRRDDGAKSHDGTDGHNSCPDLNDTCSDERAGIRASNWQSAVALGRGSAGAPGGSARPDARLRVIRLHQS